MSEEQDKTTNQVISDATVQEVIPAKPTALSDEDLNNVAGGSAGITVFASSLGSLNASSPAILQVHHRGGGGTQV